MPKFLLRFLLSPKLPVAVGLVVIVFLGGLLTAYSPMPGRLSGPHSALAHATSFDGCDTCHGDEGITRGCLDCHVEIGAQLSEQSGYHHYLAEQGKTECRDCHSEHLGTRFSLINELSWGAQTWAAFKHPHTEFGLEGRHDALACVECHKESFSLPGSEIPRDHSYLGLDQNCTSCHQDVHAEGLTPTCETCHGQDKFSPTVDFDHGAMFPLTGGHDSLACGECHVFPDAKTPPQPFPFPFEEVRGNKCLHCHESPHRTEFGVECGDCHVADQDHWRGAYHTMTPERHAETGFLLDDPHTSVDCEKCHPPELAFDLRHPNPADPGYQRHRTTCEGCHEDSHGGQFEGRHDRCIDCHETHRFQPPAFGHAQHQEIYPLRGSHLAVSCVACHREDPNTQVRGFVGTTRECRVCHESPHAGQFADQIASGDCKVCHDDSAGTFVMKSFDHEARTGYALEGAHIGARCVDCHRERKFEVDGREVVARGFEGTPHECSACHVDVHLGQFQVHGTCSYCHESSTDWGDVSFDHNTQSRFSLTGIHARLECSKCHIPVKLADGKKVTQYRPLPHKCGDCHEIPDNAARIRFR